MTLEEVQDLRLIAMTKLLLEGPDEQNEVDESLDGTTQEKTNTKGVPELATTRTRATKENADGTTTSSSETYDAKTKQTTTENTVYKKDGSRTTTETVTNEPPLSITSSKEKREYDTNGKLTSTVTTKYNPTNGGKIETITTTPHDKTFFGGGGGSTRVTQPVDPDGPKTTENLDSKGKVMSTTTVTTDSKENSVTTVTKDSKGHRINSSVATTNPKDNSVTTDHYGKEITNQGPNNTAGNLTHSTKETTAPDGSVTTNHYNASGDITHSTKETTVPPPNGSVTTNHYNASGDMTKIVTKPDTGDSVDTRTFTNPGVQGDYSGKTDTVTTVNGEEIKGSVRHGPDNAQGLTEDMRAPAPRP